MVRILERNRHLHIKKELDRLQGYVEIVAGRDKSAYPND